MKRVLPFIFYAFVLGCKTEGDVDPASGTFIRYFGSENSINAVTALEVDNGFTLIGNLEKQSTDVTKVFYKIKLIRTDNSGNFVRETSYPDFSDDSTSFKASSFMALVDPGTENLSGYLIVGEKINDSKPTQLLLLRTEPDGTLRDSITISANPATTSITSLHGSAVMLDPADGNYIVLASLTDDPNNDDMFIGKYSAQDFKPLWSHKYGAGRSTLINRIYTNTNKDLLWAGSVLTSSKFDFRLVTTTEDSQTAIIGGNIGKTDADENVLDFCQSVGGWAFTGSINEDGGNDDIYVSKITNKSFLLLGKSYDFAQQNDKGNSICKGIDDGLVVLATVTSTATQEDLYVMKVDAITGEKIWAYNYGGGDKEEGASITPLSDGYLILGTTSFGRTKKLMLMKVNSEGKL